MLDCLDIGNRLIQVFKKFFACDRVNIFDDGIIYWLIIDDKNNRTQISFAIQAKSLDHGIGFFFWTKANSFWFDDDKHTKVLLGWEKKVCSHNEEKNNHWPVLSIQKTDDDNPQCHRPKQCIPQSTSLIHFSLIDMELHEGKKN